MQVLGLSVSLKLLPAKSQFVSVQLPLSQLLWLSVIPEPADGWSLFLCCRWRQLRRGQRCLQPRGQGVLRPAELCPPQLGDELPRGSHLPPGEPCWVGGQCSAGDTVVLGHGKQTASVLRVRIQCLAKDSASGVGWCWGHLQVSFGSHLGQSTTKSPSFPKDCACWGFSMCSVLPPWHGGFCGWSQIVISTVTPGEWSLLSCSASAGPNLPRPWGGPISVSQILQLV